MEHKEFTVHDRLGPVTVTGALLAEMRFGFVDKPRWTDMALYRITDTMGERVVITRCSGCKPARRLTVDALMLADAPLVCGRCETPFKPFARQGEEPFKYALEIVARSVLYHQVPGPCVKPRHHVTTVGDVYESKQRWKWLSPCRRCRPLDLQLMPDSAKIAEEQEESYVYLCAQASSVVEKLYRRNGEISDLAAKLLLAAADMDADIKTAINGPRRI